VSFAYLTRLVSETDENETVQNKLKNKMDEFLAKMGYKKLKMQRIQQITNISKNEFSTLSIKVEPLLSESSLALHNQQILHSLTLPKFTSNGK
jgi:hypothetical protein